MPQRLFTLEEANALVPDLARVVPKLRDALHRYRFSKEQVADLETMWSGPGRAGLEHEDNPDRADYSRLLAEAHAAEREAKVLLGLLQTLAVEVKDPTLGLVDFPTQRGDEIVYLCWQEGEERIVAWHDLASGFAGRRPIGEL